MPVIVFPDVILKSKVLVVYRPYRPDQPDRQITRPAMNIPLIPDAPEDEDWREKCKPKFGHALDFHDFPRLPEPCEECTNEGSCKRIGQCLRFKCAFGEVAKP